MKYLHESKPPIIHRDLKPDNILIVENIINNRFLKLCDFGLATHHDMPSMSHTAGVGTDQYMAIEAKQGRYTIKTDIFNLFVQCFHLNLNVKTSSDEPPNVTDHVHSQPVPNPRRNTFKTMAERRMDDADYCPDLHPNTVKKEITIVLLGASGVGKSTFINAIVNYMSFESMDAANGRPICLMPVSFTIVDPTTKELLTIALSDQDHTLEQIKDTTKSVTQYPMCYKFEDDNIVLNIIDTPGIADTDAIIEKLMLFVFS
ncbi:unnamed protein product [Medioppia subpectinata]|uniref:Protein kinase domain-containing protein n=1 Tax=Medioppia subpectinata TaxID=1979941 RepID=A0A7R9KEB4_9ACAR|nr:unnamed protein product [Medioppia subpectinata]CAG2101744.1 unnamed protein product [Medioppia subpectinata]